MNFVESVGLVSDVLSVIFLALMLLCIFTYAVSYVIGDINRNKEEEKRKEERAEELEDEIDFILAKLGYVKKTKDEDNKE